MRIKSPSKKHFKIYKRYFAKVVVVGIAPVFDERIQPMSWKTTHGYSNKNISKYNKTLQKFTEEQDLFFVDLDNVYGDNLDGLLPDGLHPNAEGHRLIFEKVKAVLEEKGLL